MFDAGRTAVFTKWNQKLQAGTLDKTSPLSKLNVGTSYFVAPKNFSLDATGGAGRNQNIVLTDLQKIITRFENEESSATKGMSEEAMIERHKKRPEGIRKVERLIANLEANKPGASINGREVH